jgi:diacylglycerol kinase (ATP)
MIQTMVILNPSAGRLTKKNRLAYYYQLLSEYPQYETQFFLTDFSTSASNVVEKYHKDFDLIIAIGGDGTFNRVLTGLINANSNIPIGYIPTGTTNDFARTHNLLVSPTQAMEIINNYHVKQVDIGQFNDQYFSYVASFGAYTAVSIKTSQKLKNLFGYYAYILTSFLHIDSLKKYTIALTIDGVTTNEDVIFFAVANATSIGGILNFNFDQISLDDGFLDMCYIRFPKNGRDIFTILHSLRKQDYTHPSIVLQKVTNVTVTSQRSLLWSVDGEDGGNLKQTNISCLPKKLAIIKP